MIPSFIDPLSIKCGYATILNTTNPAIIHDLYCTASLSYEWYLIYVKTIHIVDSVFNNECRITILNDFGGTLKGSTPQKLLQSGTFLDSMYSNEVFNWLNVFGFGVSLRYDLGAGANQTCQSTLVYGLTYEKTKKMSKRKRHELYNSKE